MKQNTYTHLSLSNLVQVTLTDHGKAVAKYNLLEKHDFISSAWYESESIKLGLHLHKAVVTLPFVDLLTLLKHPDSSLLDMIDGDLKVIIYEYDDNDSLQ